MFGTEIYWFCCVFCWVLRSLYEIEPVYSSVWRKRHFVWHGNLLVLLCFLLGFKIAVRNRASLLKCVEETTFCLARKSIGFVVSASSLFAATVTPRNTIFGHLKQLKEVNVVIFPVDLWSLNIDSYQGPISHKSRNFSGLSRVPQVPLYLRNAEVLSHQSSQSSWFFLHSKHVKRSAFQNKCIAV